MNRCPAEIAGGRCAGLEGHDGEHYANARERASVGDIADCYPSPGQLAAGVVDPEAHLLIALRSARVALCDAIEWLEELTPTKSRVARLAIYKGARDEIETALASRGRL